MPDRQTIFEQQLEIMRSICLQGMNDVYNGDRKKTAHQFERTIQLIVRERNFHEIRTVDLYKKYRGIYNNAYDSYNIIVMETES